MHSPLAATAALRMTGSTPLEGIHPRHVPPALTMNRIDTGPWAGPLRAGDECTNGPWVLLSAPVRGRRGTTVTGVDSEPAHLQFPGEGAGSTWRPALQGDAQVGGAVPSVRRGRRKSRQVTASKGSVLLRGGREPGPRKRRSGPPFRRSPDGPRRGQEAAVARATAFARSNRPRAMRTQAPSLCLALFCGCRRLWSER